MARRFLFGALQTRPSFALFLQQLCCNDITVIATIAFATPHNANFVLNIDWLLSNETAKALSRQVFSTFWQLHSSSFALSQSGQDVLLEQSTPQ